MKIGDTTVKHGEGPDLRTEDLEGLRPQGPIIKWYLENCSSHYDSHGLGHVTNISLKTATNLLLQAQLTWSGGLPDDPKVQGTKPKNATGSPQLVISWDESSSAFSCTVYAGWQLEDGGYSIKPLVTKTRITPSTLRAYQEWS